MDFPCLHLSEVDVSHSSQLIDFQKNLRGTKQSIKKKRTWPKCAVIAVMFPVGSHDSFLASCHRTVPSGRGEEALLQLILSLKKHLHLQPASSRGEPEPHYCHYCRGE